MKPQIKLMKDPYQPSPKQAQIHRLFHKGKRYVAAITGIRFGKTAAAANQAKYFVYVHKILPPLGWVLVPTYKQGEAFRSEFEKFCGNFISRYLKQDNAYLLYPPQGCPEPYYRIDIRSADNPDHLRGPTVGWIIVDEAALISVDAWRIARGRVLSTGGPILIITTPRGKNNWVYEEFVKRAIEGHPRYAVISARTQDNSLLSQEEINQLRCDYPEDFAAQELEGRFLSLEGLVYAHFDASIHVVDPLDSEELQDAEVFCGIDFGYSDPFVCLWIARSGDTFTVVDEHYLSGDLLDNHAKRILAHPLAPRVRRYYADPSGLQWRVELRNRGVTTVGAINEMDAGIRTVARLLEQTSIDGRPRLRVSSKCQNTIREFHTYRYKTSRSLNTAEKIRDKNNHAMDALRYALHSYGMMASPISPVYSESRPSNPMDSPWAGTRYAPYQPKRLFASVRQDNGFPRWYFE